MTELERARGGRNIVDNLNLSRSAYNWLSRKIDPVVLQSMENAQRFLKKLFLGKSIDISTNIDELANSLDEEFIIHMPAWVEVKSKEFYITDTKQFSQMKEYCDSISFVPHTDGTIGIVLYFDGLIRKVERGKRWV